MQAAPSGLYRPVTLPVRTDLAYRLDGDVTSVPEPGAFVMAGLGLLGLLGVAKRRG